MKAYRWLAIYLQLFLTCVPDGDEGIRFTALITGKRSPLSIEQDAGCASLPVWKLWRSEKSLSMLGIEWTGVELVRNLVAHGDEREGKWRGNWRMEWVASTLTPSPNMVYPASLKLMRTPRLPAVDWTDAPAVLNGLVRFGERRNLVSARVPSRSARAINQNEYRS